MFQKILTTFILLMVLSFPINGQNLDDISEDLNKQLISKVKKMTSDQELKIDELSKKIESLSKENQLLISSADNSLNYSRLLINWISALVAFLGILMTLCTFTLGYIVHKNNEKIKVTVEKLRSSELDVGKIKSEIETKKIEINKLLETSQNTKTELEKVVSVLIEKNNSDMEKVKISINKMSEKFDIALKTQFDFKDAYEHMNVGNVKYAIKKFKKILEYNAEYIDAKCQLALCYCCINENDHAKAIIENVLNESTENMFAHKIYGQILRRDKECPKSIIQFKKAIQLGLFENSIYSHLGYAYMFNKEYQKSSDSFLQALKNNDKDPAPLYGLVKVDFLKYGTSDRVIEALTLANRAIELNPANPYPHFGICFLEMLSNKEECVASLKNATERFKNISILKEQLEEYSLFNTEKYYFLPDCIDVITIEINKSYKI